MTPSQLIYTRKGRTYVETGDAARLAKKLETIRCDAELFELRNGKHADRIGGCERANAPDDRRIKWQWWYDRAACGLEVEGMHREVATGSVTPGHTLSDAGQEYTA